MAQKERIVIVFDINRHCMEHVFEKAKHCLRRMIEMKIVAQSKDEVGLVLCGSTNSNNSMYSPEEPDAGYAYIEVKCPPSVASFDLVRIADSIQLTEKQADIMDSVVIGFEISQNVKARTASRVFLISELNGPLDSTVIDNVKNGMQKHSLKLSVLCSFDLQSDELAGLQKTNATAIQSLIDVCDGDVLTYDEIVPELDYFPSKATKPAPWNATFRLGSKLVLPITGYTKVTPLTPPTWKFANERIIKVDTLQKSQTSRTDTSLTPSQRYIPGDDANEVVKDDTVVGYSYGNTLVPSVDTFRYVPEQNIKGMQLLKFARMSELSPHWFWGNKTMYITGRKGYLKENQVLSHMIRSMEAQQLVAIVR